VDRTRLLANVREAVPFLWVHDLEASLRFYVQGLGFHVAAEWVDSGKRRWCRLQVGDAALMLQEFWSEGPHRNLPDSRTGLGVSICFVCEDAVALWREFVDRGIAADRPFVGNGMWVTHLRDPDGYQLTFESDTEAPEETILPDE
jgi:catechol 2,3-dioxygenase-like lactoylglutathione lyase family enzyme